MSVTDLRGKMADGGRGRGAIGRVIGLAWHHTAVFYPAARLTPEDEVNHIRMIEQYHISLGYIVFAYHGIVFASGRAYLTGDLERMRSHVASRNHELVGFCIAGDYSQSEPDAGALAAAAELRALFVAEYGRQAEKGHADWALPAYPTSCPGARRNEWIPKIAEEDHMASVEYSELMRAIDALAARVGALERGPHPAPVLSTYTVQPGDSLDGIARWFGVDGGWQALYDANVAVIGPNPSIIHAGQVLVLP